MRDFKFLFLCLIWLQFCSFIICSEGDRSPFYQNCLRNCNRKNCTEDLKFKPEIKEKLHFYVKLLWNCQDNCRYHCMWRTVQGFKERGLDTPKFHGKWPFRRVMGIQEPASVMGSNLNLLAHVYMYNEIQARFSVRTTPVVLLWYIFAWICMNGWAWSMVFHSRDVFFTEFMDYACALSMVLSLFLAAVIRIFYRQRKATACIVLVTVLYYVDHVRYLYSGRVDYDYNMMVNVVFGVVGSILWLVWACGEYLAGRRYAWRMVAFTLLSGATLLLELMDFPPKNDSWDAHSLWHISTAPLPLLFYRFVIDDLYHLRNPAPLDKPNLKHT